MSTQITDNNVPEIENVVDTSPKVKMPLSKKKIAVFAVVAIVVVALVFALTYESEYDRVLRECNPGNACIKIGDGYFIIDTYNNSYDALDPVVKASLADLFARMQSDSLEAIQYANREFGFSYYLYERMINTSALMGRQYEENDKYRVSWTYHPDNGLEVTYEKKR